MPLVTEYNNPQPSVGPVLGLAHTRCSALAAGSYALPPCLEDPSLLQAAHQGVRPPLSRPLQLLLLPPAEVAPADSASEHPPSTSHCPPHPPPQSQDVRVTKRS